MLTKVSKEKECEHLAECIKPCRNHLMWSATSTPSCDGELKQYGPNLSLSFHILLINMQTFLMASSTSVCMERLFLTGGGLQNVDMLFISLHKMQPCSQGHCCGGRREQAQGRSCIKCPAPVVL